MNTADLATMVHGMSDNIIKHLIVILWILPCYAM